MPRSFLIRTIRRINYAVFLVLAVIICWVGTSFKNYYDPWGNSVSLHLASPTVVAVESDPKSVVHALQETYHPHWFDQRKSIGVNTWLVRGGLFRGTLVGIQQALLYPFDQYSQASNFNSWLAKSSRYRIWSSEDAHYRHPVSPVAVYHKAKPVDVAQVGVRRKRWPLHHTVYLELPYPLAIGCTYNISVSSQGNLFKSSLTFRHQPDHQVSHAVHVSQVGFRPDDLRKVGFLSTWMGTGGALSYPEGIRFRLIDEASNETIFTGYSHLRTHRDTPEDPRNRTYTLTEVYELDFSSVNRLGQYRLCVDGIGCSLTFDIGENTWHDAFYIAMQGFYHQRSGIALEAPYADTPRPRPFHPDDGLKVYQSRTPLMDTGNGLNAQGTDVGNFKNLVAGKTNEIVPNAWGGYFDAGDWDRRIQHLRVARALLELLEFFPDYFQTLSLNLPESTNALPDIVDEALWGVDFFRRLQMPDGGIRGGIESAAHPKRGETSWQESLTVMAYAPGPWSSYIYAGVAARVARLIQPYVPSKVDGYQQSALAAMEFAEKAYVKGIVALPPAQAVIEAERSLAALELYHLTQDVKWHDIFKLAKHQAETNPDVDYRVHEPLQEGSFLYAKLPSDLAEPGLQAQSLRIVLDHANQAMQLGNTTAFGWTKRRPMTPVGWGNGLGSPKVMMLLRAHYLTGQNRYLSSALLGCQFAAGANPSNMTFTTGVGQRYPQHPHVLDHRRMNWPNPSGITVYGPIDSVAYSDYWMFDVLDRVTVPPVREWPTVETYFDIYVAPAINEFTVMQSMTDVAYAWGYLSARDRLQ